MARKKMNTENSTSDSDKVKRTSINSIDKMLACVEFAVDDSDYVVEVDCGNNTIIPVTVKRHLSIQDTAAFVESVKNIVFANGTYNSWAECENFAFKVAVLKHFTSIETNMSIDKLCQLTRSKVYDYITRDIDSDYLYELQTSVDNTIIYNRKAISSNAYTLLYETWNVIKKEQEQMTDTLAGLGELMNKMKVDNKTAEKAIKNIASIDKEKIIDMLVSRLPEEAPIVPDENAETTNN